MNRRSNFFLYTSYALLAIVLLGFTPTFYLRAFFDVPAIPTYVYVHGVAMTAWFVWLCVQTTAVFNGRVALHRKLGMIGMTIGAVVLLTGAITAVKLAPRLLEKYGDIESDLPWIAGIVWGNIAGLVAFGGFLFLAFLYRQKPEIHKRLILLASIAVTLQALGRISKFPMIDLPEGPFALLSLLTLLVILGIYDKRRLGSVQRVTWIGGCALLATLITFGFVIANTAFGRAFVLVLT
jgi:hypothetical protein